MSGASEREPVDTTWVELPPRPPLFSDNLFDWVARFFMWTLRSLNPDPEVWLDHHPLHPGAKFSVGWAFHPGITPLRDVRITLEGAELAQEEGGESIFTHRSVFSTSVLVDDTYRAATRGRSDGSVPGGTMPSFRGDGRRIEWTIHVVGSAALPWPATDQHFVVDVFPPMDEGGAQA